MVGPPEQHCTVACWQTVFLLLRLDLAPCWKLSCGGPLFAGPAACNARHKISVTKTSLYSHTFAGRLTQAKRDHVSLTTPSPVPSPSFIVFYKHWCNALRYYIK